jgi:hypothetical protein
MATYTPTNFFGGGGTAAALSTTITTYAQAVTGTVSILRTVHAICPAGGKTFSLSIGADVLTGTRLFASIALAANVPFLENGWIVMAATNATHALDAQSNDTVTGSVLLNASGYLYA